jgi:hypothetical protein
MSRVGAESGRALFAYLPNSLFAAFSIREVWDYLHM